MERLTPDIFERQMSMKAKNINGGAFSKMPKILPLNEWGKASFEITRRISEANMPVEVLPTILFRKKFSPFFKNVSSEVSFLKYKDENSREIACHGNQIYINNDYRFDVLKMSNRR